jgi:hypothetical protein
MTETVSLLFYEIPLLFTPDDYIFVLICFNKSINGWGGPWPLARDLRGAGKKLSYIKGLLE